MNNRLIRLSRGELALWGLGLFLAAAFGGYVLALKQSSERLQTVARVVPEPGDELAGLRAKYGPTHYSQGIEEWIIRDFFHDERGGVFVDVGANDPRVNSNTYYLETALAWSGVAIEPQRKFATAYRMLRPKTIFIPLFVSDVSNEQAMLYVPENDLLASGTREFAETFGAVTPTPTTTTTLDDVLDRLKIARVDFLSMDIELAEPQGLGGFSIGRFQPRLVGIEAHAPVRQQILEYFATRGYSLIGKYLRIDGENFWFAPTGTVCDDVPAQTARLTSANSNCVSP